MKSTIVKSVFGALAAATTMTAFASDLDMLVSQQRELMKKQAQLALLKMDKQIRDEQSPGTAAVPGAGAGAGMGAMPANSRPVPSIEPSRSAMFSEDLELNAIYGVGDNLDAHITYHNFTRPLKVGAVIGGWQLVKINRDSVTMSRSGGKKGQAHVRTLPLLAPPPEPMMQFAGLATVPDLGGVRPAGNPQQAFAGQSSVPQGPKQPRFGSN
jgi:type IV pilus biogenesis protein PilP